MAVFGGDFDFSPTTNRLVISGTIAGYAGGRVIYGGSASGEDLQLESTSHATPGTIFLGKTIGDNRVVINGAEDSVVISGTSFPGRLLIHDEVSTAALFGTHLHHASAAGPIHYLAKSRGTEASESVVASGDRIGQFNFLGFDGTDYETGAAIAAEVDATPGNNDMPGRLQFYTTPDGSVSTTERMRITSAGGIWVGNYLQVGALSAPSNTTAGDITGIRLHLGTDGALGTTLGIVAGDVSMSGTKNLGVGGSLFNVLNTVGGANDSPRILQFAPTYTPSANINTSYTMLGTPTLTPASGVVIAEHIALYIGMSYGAAVGGSDVTTVKNIYIAGNGLAASAIIPTTQYGIHVANIGNTGMTTASNIRLDQPTGATNNNYFELDTDDTTIPVGLAGRLPARIAGANVHIPRVA